MRSNDEDHIASLADDENEARRLGSRTPRHVGRVDHATGEDINTRMAAMRVRSWCNQHECTKPRDGVCEHPNHRRDDDRLLSQDPEFPGMLDMLGLSHEYPAYSEDEHRLWLRWLGQSGPPESIGGIGLEDAA